MWDSRDIAAGRMAVKTGLFLVRKQGENDQGYAPGWILI